MGSEIEKACLAFSSTVSSVDPPPTSTRSVMRSWRPSRRTTASSMRRASSTPSITSSSMPASRRARSTSVAAFFASRTALVAVARYASTCASSIARRNSRRAPHACPIDAGASLPVKNTSVPRRTAARRLAISRQPSPFNPSVVSGSESCGALLSGALASTMRRRIAFEPTSIAANRARSRSPVAASATQSPFGVSARKRDLIAPQPSMGLVGIAR